MPYNMNAQKTYVKGTMDVYVYNYENGNLDYHSSVVQNNQLTTSVNMGAINAGIGNPVVINIPDTSQVNLALTAADFSLEARQLSVGGTLTYNAIVPVTEAVVASGATIAVTGTPAIPYGMSGYFCLIDGDGAAYEIDPETKEVIGFSAVAGNTYCVRYFTESASSRALAMATVFTPGIKTVVCRLAAYSQQGGGATQGSLVGYYYVWIPRMQFGGRADADGSQTAAATTDLSGSALSYTPPQTSGACADQSAILAIMVYMPLAGATSAVEGLAVVGGSVSVAQGDSIQIPVKYVIGGELVQPNYADLTYEVTSSSVASVSETGVITGTTAGDTEVTITLADPALSCVANVSVTA